MLSRARFPFFALGCGEGLGEEAYIHGEGRALRINESRLLMMMWLGRNGLRCFLSLCIVNRLHAYGTRCFSQFEHGNPISGLVLACIRDVTCDS